MGPSTQRDKHAARMDAARSLLQAPAASPADRAPVAEWSSPTFTRARARPSNLHTYLRTSASIPLSQAYSRNSAGHSGHSEPHAHARMAGSVSSPSSAGGSTSSGHATLRAINTTAVRSASGHASKAKGARESQQAEWRSQRTQATQTQELDASGSFPHASGDASIRLGTFGDVRGMPMETVDFLIRVLEDRKQELLLPSGSSDKKRAASRASSSGDNDASPASAAARRSARHAASTDAKHGSSSNTQSVQQEDEYTESSDESDTCPLTRTPVARSRSYEALVQLEAILEARHQQLMKDGILEPPPAAAGDNQDDTTDDEDRSKAARTDIQEEIRKMHRSVRQQRKPQAEALASGFESFFQD